jgi:hypothetical protein
MRSWEAVLARRRADALSENNGHQRQRRRRFAPVVQPLMPNARYRPPARPNLQAGGYRFDPGWLDWLFGKSPDRKSTKSQQSLRRLRLCRQLGEQRRNLGRALDAGAGSLGQPSSQPAARPGVISAVIGGDGRQQAPQGGRTRGQPRRRSLTLRLSNSLAFIAQRTDIAVYDWQASAKPEREPGKIQGRGIVKPLKRQPPRAAVPHLRCRVLLSLPSALALLAGAAALTAGPADAHKAPRPGVSVSATPTSVPSGGTTTLTISVSGEAKECELHIVGPTEVPSETFPCESGTYERKVTMPTNRTGHSVKYKPYLCAISPGGTRSKKAKAKVRVESTFTVEMLQRLASETTYTKETLRGKAPLTVEYEIVVSNTGEQVPVKLDNIQDSLVPGCETPPKQREVKLGESGVVEATCSHTIVEPQQTFENEVIVKGKFFPHQGSAESSFEVALGAAVETEEL